ncbi:MAG: DNA methyltransferase, partial [bacterium]
GLTHVHHFYSNRNLWTLASFVAKSEKQLEFWFAVTRVASQITKRYRLTHQNGVWGAGGGPLPGNLYVPSLVKELAMPKQLRRAIKDHARVRGTERPRTFRIMTNSSSQLSSVRDSCVDYIFVDPPFGGNLMYSELNFLWEAWLRVFTNNKPEAIENSVQGKGASEYQRLMTRCFQEYYRVLKPGRWMTVEFHNSKNRVWNAIQEALQRAGFVVADVRTLDKKKKTFNQVTASGAVKQDLIISAYKATGRLEERFKIEAGTAEGAWSFVRQHLAQLPVVVRTDGHLETLSERQDYLLFDRMVAFHIQRGATVPLSAGEFYRGLRGRFVERDGMFFLPDQVPEYDRARLEAESVAQLSLFVDDEKSTIRWLRQQLDPKTGGHPQTYQEIQPKFLQQLHQARHEELPELSEILEQNFLQDEKDRWYVPDPNKASDLEKLRRKALLREFREYVDERGRLRKFRTEAVRAGFADAWQRSDYETIVHVAERLPDSVLQEDADLLMYYDNASLRVE